jgi:Bacterial Ig-like domain (group 3)/Bacterial toxin homologue of phage lysozyme, C-term
MIDILDRVRAFFDCPCMTTATTRRRRVGFIPSPDGLEARFLLSISNQQATVSAACAAGIISATGLPNDKGFNYSTVQPPDPITPILSSSSDTIDDPTYPDSTSSYDISLETSFSGADSQFGSVAMSGSAASTMTVLPTRLSGETSGFFCTYNLSYDNNTAALLTISYDLTSSSPSDNNSLSIEITNFAHTITEGTGTYTLIIPAGVGFLIQAGIAGGSSQSQVGSSETTASCNFSWGLSSAAQADIALISSPNPSAYGQSVTFNATVSPASSGLPPPTGIVTFMDGSTILNPGGTQLVSGIATYTTTSTQILPVGTDTITAVYGGDRNFSGNTSNAVTQTVNQAPTLPDIAIQDVALAGDNLIFSYDVVNFHGSFTVGLYYSADKQFNPDPAIDKSIASLTLTPDSPNPSRFDLSQSHYFDPTRPYLIVVADPPVLGGPSYGKVEESNEDNNVSAALDTRFVVPSGQITFNAEGNDNPNSPFYSRHIHWPGGQSGVTIGRGYDMGGRTSKQVVADLKAAGVPPDKAQAFGRGEKKKGTAAKKFVQSNQSILGEITPQEQKALFELIYPIYVSRAIKYYNKWTVDKKGNPLPDRVPWENLHPAIRDVLVDFAYQGTRKSDFLAGMQNSYDQLMAYIRTTPRVYKYEPGRHRIEYLMQAEASGV